MPEAAVEPFPIWANVNDAEQHIRIQLLKAIRREHYLDAERFANILVGLNTVPR